jgi:hypothetical protein
LVDFSLGLNDKDDPTLISDKALADVENKVIGVGFVSKRHGYIKYTPVALANAIKKLYTFFKNSGSNEFLAISNLKVYKDTAGTLSEMTFVTITALSSNNVQMLTYKDRSLADVVLLADTGKLKAYNGTNVSEVTPHTATAPEATDPGSNDLVNLTNFRAIAIKQDRIFALAHATVKNRLSFCHHDPTLGYATYDYWPAVFFFDLVSEQNDEALTIRTFRNAIVVFNKHSMWSLTGDGRTISDYTLNRINVADGLAAVESVCFVGNNIFYLSNDDKIYSLFATDQNYISAQVISTDPTTRSSVETTIKGISLADKALAVGTFFDNKYWLSFPSGLTLVYDLDLKCWTKYLNIKANSFLNRDGVLYFSTTTGYIYKFDETVFNDDGAAIVTMMKTKKADYGVPVQTKKYRNAWVTAKQYDAQSSTFNLSAIIDDITINIDDISTDESGVWDEGDWDEMTWDFKDVVQKKTSLRKRGRTIQYVITTDVVDEPLTIYQIITQFKLKKPK